MSLQKLAQDAARGNIPADKHLVIGQLNMVIHADRIDQLLSPRSPQSLNWIAKESTTLLLELTTSPYTATDVHIDAVRVILQYQALMTGLSPQIPNTTGAQKAEDKYVSVTASSIAAKYQRDLLQERPFHHFGREPVDVQTNNEFDLFEPPGSGYPADEQTSAWLTVVEKHHNTYPSKLRRSWRTTHLCMV